MMPFINIAPISYYFISEKEKSEIESKTHLKRPLKHFTASIADLNGQKVQCTLNGRNKNAFEIHKRFQSLATNEHNYK